MNSPAFVHSQAIVDDAALIGKDTRIWAFAQVMANTEVGDECSISGFTFIEGGAKIGSRVTVKNGCFIWDGVIIEDDCFIGPNVTFTNDKYPRSPRMESANERYSTPENWRVETVISKGVSIGAGSIITSGVTIGEYAMIGAGSLVTKDVPSYALFYGQPAESHGKVCICGIKKTIHIPCENCGQ